MSRYCALMRRYCCIIGVCWAFTGCMLGGRRRASLGPGRLAETSGRAWKKAGVLSTIWHASCILPIIRRRLNPSGIGAPPRSMTTATSNPATKRLLGGFLRIVAALLAVGILAFLYVKSESGELRRQAQVGTYLRQLREIDAAWSRDLTTARSDPFATEARPLPGGQRLQAALDALHSETAALQDPGLDTGFASLRQSFLQKQGMVEQFAQQGERLRTGVRAYLSQLGDVRQKAAEMPAALRPGVAELDGRLVSLYGEILRLHAQPAA